MGRELAKVWLDDLYEERYSNSHMLRPSIEEWANNELPILLKIPSFTYDKRENFYPSIYRHRFHEHPQEGFAFLEKEMIGKEPSLGYIVLAQIMATAEHRIAVTTNFDNLISDALATYTGTAALSCDHESLAHFAKPDIKRPLILKIHRDVFFAPLSTPEEISVLAKEWREPLTEIFKNYTPIVIGFGDSGGGGGSLLGFLQDLPPIKGGLYWCYRDKILPQDPALEIQDIVRHHKGRLVPIPGFDELMLNLWRKMKLTSLSPDLDKRFGLIATNYRNKFTAVAENLLERAKLENHSTLTTAAYLAEEALEEFERDGG